MNAIECDNRGNPVHYTCMTATCGQAEVWVEYDYSNPRRIDAHIYHMKFFKTGREIVEPRKWVKES